MKYIIVVLILLSVTLISCVEKLLTDNHTNAGNSILTIKIADSGIGSQATASSTVEDKVSRLEVFIFNKNACEVMEVVQSPTMPYTFKFKRDLKTVDIYVVANMNTGLTQQTATPTLLKEIKHSNFASSETLYYPSDSAPIVMSAFLLNHNVIIQPSATVNLDRLTSKIRLMVKVDDTMRKYDLDNMSVMAMNAPASTTLFKETTPSGISLIDYPWAGALNKKLPLRPDPDKAGAQEYIYVYEDLRPLIPNTKRLELLINIPTSGKDIKWEENNLYKIKVNPSDHYIIKRNTIQTLTIVINGLGKQAEPPHETSDRISTVRMDVDDSREIVKGIGL